MEPQTKMLAVDQLLTRQSFVVIMSFVLHIKRAYMFFVLLPFSFLISDIQGITLSLTALARLAILRYC
jgi:hypothetical protein